MNLDRRPAAGRDHIAELVGRRTGHVLHQPDRRHEVDRQPEGGDRRRRGQGRRTPRHIALHRQHRLGRLERQTAGIERHPLADEGEVERGGRLAIPLVPEDHQPRRPGAPAADGEDRPATLGAEPVLVPDLDLQAGAAGDRRRLGGERLRIQIVGGRVDEPAGEVHAVGDRRTRADQRRRQADPGGRAERCPAPLGTIQVLPGHSHRRPGHGLLGERCRPAGITEERDPAPGPPCQVPGRRGRGPVEDAGIDLLAFAEPHEQHLAGREAGGRQQRHALVPLPGKFPTCRDPRHEAAGRLVDGRRHTCAGAPFRHEHDQCLGIDRLGRDSGFSDDPCAAAGRGEFLAHGTGSEGDTKTRLTTAML